MQYLVIHHQQSHRPRKLSKEVLALAYVQVEKGIDLIEPEVVFEQWTKPCSKLLSDWIFATLGAEACCPTAGPERCYRVK